MARKKPAPPAPPPAPVAIVNPLPPRVVYVEEPTLFTPAQLREGIESALHAVPFTGLTIAYTESVQVALHERLLGAKTEAYNRIRDLVVEARSGRSVHTLVLPIASA